jgi:hypothetical protein
MGQFTFGASSLNPKKLISGQEDMKTKKHAFSTLVLEFFCQIL